MPILTLIGLIVTVISTALKIISILKENPEITSDVRDALARAGGALEAANIHMETAEQAHVEAP